uniref:ATP synthase complex subunit 8 n=1 Tax=Elysia cornigera TaxID=698696 RepID=A0A342LD39_9GAST|nr:ATP synthase F0 subunit 8 [Elysia cornigera]ANP26524.1 ATP synthase F0 subunit 8 [Elysia cornigera]
MPQLSPMIGVFTFLLTNLAFVIVIMSIRTSFNVTNFMESSSSKSKAFKSFS